MSTEGKGAKTQPPAEQPATDEPQGLLRKLVTIREGIERVPKRGRNEHHGYDYATAADIMETARKLLNEHRVLLLPSVSGEVNHHGTLTTVPMTFAFIDADTGERIDVPWAGVGFDKGGDKGIYKAFTGASKYLQLGVFMVPTGDDPETDAVSQKDGPGDPRDPSPRIPRDRARRITEAVKALDMDLTIYQAKLAELGVSKTTELNVDQAETVEQWLAEQNGS